MYRYDKHGHPYIAREDIPFLNQQKRGRGLNIHTDVTHTNFFILEHDYKYPLKIGLDTIEIKYGAGTRLYFTFLKFIFSINVVIGLCGLISWLFFIFDPNKTTPFQWTDLYVSNYLRYYSDKYWFYCNIIIFSVWILAIPVYFIWERYIFKRIYPSFGNNVPFQNDFIYDNVAKPSRYWLGILLTLIALGISTGVFYGLLQLQNYMSVNIKNGTVIFGLTTNTLMGIPVSLSFVISNLLWNYFSQKVTEKENYKRWTHFRISRSLKLILFKILSATILYTLIATVLIEPPNNNCSIQNSATNFLTTVLIDALLLTLVDTFVPLLGRRLKMWWYQLESDDPSLSIEFNVSEDLLQIMYRQFIICIAILVFPLVGIFACLVNLLQYGIDKYRLLRICKDPQYIEEKLGLAMFIFIVINMIASTITYPNGALWILFLPKLLPDGFQNCTMAGVINRLI